MAWNFELVAGPYKGRTGGLAWDGKGMLFSAVQEEKMLRYEPEIGKTTVFRNYTGRTNGIAIAKDGTVYGAQEGGRRVIHFRKDGSTGAMPDLLEGKHHNQPTDVIVDSKGRVWFADAYNAQVPYGPPVYPMLDRRLAHCARHARYVGTARNPAVCRRKNAVRCRWRRRARQPAAAVLLPREGRR
jgi:gluconolactonase